jgi:hypothetical protein
MMPEASAGCVCPYSLQCTIVFQPRKENRMWGMYSAPESRKPPKQLCLNLGAPGDRRDGEGKLWLSYPRPRGGKTPQERRLVFPVELKAELSPGGGYYRSNANFLKVKGSGDPWIYASGCRGLARCIIPIAKKEAGGAYTVRLHFAEPEPVQPGQRVFHVELQGRRMLQNLDIVKETGGPNRALIKEFKGLPLGDRLELSLKPVRGKPLLCGLEIMAEGAR